MNKSCPEIMKGRRRSLLAGLILILVISSIGLATNCFDYSGLSTTIAGIRSSSRLGLSNSKQEQILNEVEERRNRTRLDIIIHAGLFVVALWCMSNAIRINAAPIQPVPDGGSGEKGSSSKG
jgi:hypothetical protein